MAVVSGLVMMLGLVRPVDPQETAPAAQREVVEEAKRLNRQIVELHAGGRYDQALPLAERALALLEGALGPEHHEVAVALTSLAGLHMARASPHQAEPLYERALTIRERELGAAHPDVAASLNNLAELYRTRSEDDRAAPLYQRALAIQERALGPLHPRVAITLNNLAALYEAKADHGRAEPLWRRALAILERALGPDHPVVATILNNLAVLYAAKAEYGAAESLSQRALAIRERAFGPDHPDVAVSLNNLAGVYREKGDYNRAEPLSQRALAIRERVLGPEHPLVADALNNLALLYTARGGYGHAGELYQRALAIRERALGSEHADVAASLNNLAEVYREKGDYVRAEPLSQRALAIWERVHGPEHPHVAIGLNNLGELYSSKGEAGHAEPLHRQALAIRERALGPEHPEVALSLNNLAGVYWSKGEWDGAAALLARALAIWDRALGPEHPLVATVLNNLGEVSLSKGEPGRAKPLFQRALGIRERVLGPDHPDVAVTLNNLVGVYEARGDTAGAVAIQARASTISERNLALILSTGSEEQKRAYLATRAGETDATVSLHIHSAPRDMQALRLALTTVLRRKGRVLDAMTDSLAAARRRLAPEDQALLDQWISVRSQLARLVVKGPGKADPGQYRADLGGLARQAEQLEAQLSARSAEVRTQVQPVTIERVQQAIPRGAALVEIVSYQPINRRAQRPDAQWGAPRYAAYVLPHGGEPNWVDLGETAPIDREVGELRVALSDPDRTVVRRLARHVDERVMRPIRALLGETGMVLLSPDGALNLIPFGALVDESDRYLIERFTFIYLTTGRDLLRVGTKGPARQGPLVLADPDFDDAGNQVAPQTRTAAGARAQSRRSTDGSAMHFRPLPGTADEGAALRNLLPGITVLTGRAATEAALKQAQGPRILHVASHGFFLADQAAVTYREPLMASGAFQRSHGRGSENPLLRSGLALAGANREQSEDEDGLLTALEAAGLDLWGTKLVVLSACETAVGAVQTGEGVYGLRRALVMAGAESQVMSLWKVDDLATRDLVVAYYKRLLGGGGRAAALRLAQLEMLASENRGHPFYWASFIPVGDWAPIEEQGASRP